MPEFSLPWPRTRRLPSLWWATLATTAAGLALLWAAAPTENLRHTSAPNATPAMPLGPVLEQAQQRGQLRVAVRHYARPSLPGSPLAPEPDDVDQALAQWLAQRLGVQLAWVDAPRADIALQGQLPAGGAALQATAYGPDQLQWVTLRQHAARWEAAAPGHWRHLLAQLPLLGPWWSASTAGAPAPHRPTVCIGQGLAIPTAWHNGSVQLRVAPSPIHAISNFMAGQCDVLADSPDAIERLVRQNSWRFYTTVGQPWNARTPAPPPDTHQPHTAHDATSQHWLAQQMVQWRASGLQRAALAHRASTVALEASLLEDGAICH